MLMYAFFQAYISLMYEVHSLHDPKLFLENNLNIVKFNQVQFIFCNYILQDKLLTIFENIAYEMWQNIS